MAYYTEQFQRIQRLYEKINRLGEGSSEYLDDLFCFFINCYHMKDWLKKDDSISKEVKDKVEDYINENDCLKICGGIANRSKHLILDEDNDRRGKMRASVIIDIGSGSSAGEYSAILESESDKEYDVLEVAKKCVEAWEFFLKENNLII